MRNGFNLSTVFDTVARAVPDREVLVWRDRRLTYEELNARADGLAAFLAGRGLGCRTERDVLAGHQSGQDHVGLYLHNGNEYLEAMIAGCRARVAPFGVPPRSTDEELVRLLAHSGARALVYHAAFAPRVEAVRDRLPRLEVLIEVADQPEQEPLIGAVDYESVLEVPAPGGGMPAPSGDDLFIVHTGGTAGPPKAVLWRNDDLFVTATGGAPPGTGTGTAEPVSSYGAVADAARDSDGGPAVLVVAPFAHRAAQWAAFQAITAGGRVVLPDEVCHLDAAEALQSAARERVSTLQVVGDAVAGPLVEEAERGGHDLTELVAVHNDGAPLTPQMRSRLLSALPHVVVTDVVGAAETGPLMSATSVKGVEADPAIFAPGPSATVVDDLLTRVLEPGEGEGWLAQRGRPPLGYLGDEAGTARAFPVIDGDRFSVPGDRAVLLEDGRIVLRGRADRRIGGAQ